MREPLKDRVRRVCSLKEGWYNGGRGKEGEAIKVDPNLVIEIVEALMSRGFPRPMICPGLDGQVVLEWVGGVQVEIFPGLDSNGLALR